MCWTVGTETRRQLVQEGAEASIARTLIGDDSVSHKLRQEDIDRLRTVLVGSNQILARLRQGGRCATKRL